MANLLDKIQSARSPAKVALLVRALGCQTSAGLSRVYGPGDTVDMVRRYEIDAQSIERCETIAEVRKVLRTKGYLPEPARRRGS